MFLPKHTGSFGLGKKKTITYDKMIQSKGAGRKRIYDVSRGGYAMKTVARRPTPSQPVMPVVYDKNGNFNKGSISGGAGAVIAYGLSKAARKGFNDVARALQEEVTMQLIERGKYEARRIFNPPGLTGNKERTVPFFSEEKQAPMRNAGTVEPKIMHKTKISTGNPSSKTLKEMGRENGVETRVLFDSKMWQEPSEGSSTIMNRAVLSHSCGFNCRNFMTPGTAAYVTRGDFIRATFGLDGSNVPDVGLGTASSYSDGITYASLLETMTELQFHNQSRFLPLVLSIHTVARRQGGESLVAREPSAEISALAIEVGEDDQGDTRSPKRTGIPGYYVLQSPREEASGYEFGGSFFEFDLLNSGRGLMSSPAFRDNFTIVDTKTKTLEPNDFWQFRHEHQFGSGVDMDVMTADFQNETSNAALKSADITPLSYFYIIESKGLPSEGVYNNKATNEAANNFEPRFGSSPGYYYMEIRKSIKFVRPAENSDELQPGLQGFGGPLEKRIHTRTFIKNEVDFPNNNRERRPFYRLPQQVGIGLTTTSAGAFWLPLEIETTRTLAGAESKSTVADNDPATR